MDRSLVRHAHPHCHVLIKAGGADTQFSVGNKLVQLTDTQAVLINAWEPHAYVHYEERPRTIILALYIEPDWLKTFRPNWAASSTPSFFESPAGELSPRIRQLSMDLVTIMLVNPGASAEQEQLLSDLMISVIERFTPWRTLPHSLLDVDRNRDCFDWRIRRAVNFIRESRQIAGGVDTLAREVGLSRAHFYRLFERSTRMTPHLYLNLLRVEFAINFVLHTNDTLSAISESLGFSAPAHFTRFFRDNAGVSPREFRQAARTGLAVGA